jgi:hypothetical protein
MNPTPSNSAASPTRASFRPQFSLLTLFKGVTALAVLFAVAAWAGPLWSWVLGLAALLVAAHVAGNWLGTRLRDDATDDIRREREAARDGSRLAGDAAIRPQVDAKERAAAALAHLRQRRSLGRTIHIACAAGSIVSVGLAIGLVLAIDDSRLSLSAVLVAMISAAVIGGILGFLAASFWLAASLAFSEAEGGRKQQSRPSTARERNSR